MEAQSVTADSSVIVYDYTGNQATPFAQYLASQGVENVKTFQANDLIDDVDNIVLVDVGWGNAKSSL